MKEASLFMRKNWKKKKNGSAYDRAFLLYYFYVTFSSEKCDKQKAEVQK